MQVQNDATATKLYSDIIHVNMINIHIEDEGFLTTTKGVLFRRKLGILTKLSSFYDLVHFHTIISFTRLALIPQRK